MPPLSLKSVVLLVIAFGLVSAFVINPGYFERIYAAAYNKVSVSCDYCDKTGHGINYCPEIAVNNGAAGRWIIPSVGINVACFEADIDAQSITDMRDSAALIKRDNITLLADHNYQGFSGLNNCAVGTVAYMDTGSSMQKFVCTDVLEGYNVGSDLIDLEGNVIDFKGSEGYTNYTCHFFSDRITIVHFEPI